MEVVKGKESVSNVSKTQMNEYEDRIEIHVMDDNGDADFIVYKVFEGIWLAFSSIHTDECRLTPVTEGDFIEISHCREGRLEMSSGEDYFYLTPGDLSVVKRNQMEMDVMLPLHHYHGISIVIKADFVPKVFRTMLRETPVNPMEVANKLCGDKEHYIARSEAYVEHIFSELYNVPEKIRAGYFKIKVLELLLMLSSIEVGENSEAARRMTFEQVQLAKEVCEYLRSRMHKRPTIMELSQHFHVSQTKLKEVFKGVYGMPIYSYIKVQKMQSAALQLIHTERTVLDIALDHGYSSSSKFSNVFREIMGELPLDYRRAHGKRESI